MTGSTEEQITAWRWVLARSARRVKASTRFRGRDFSRRTIDALADHGIEVPERLLFMTMQELKDIPKIRDESIKEILAYRDRFIPKG
jgi:hypothetical protein